MSPASRPGKSRSARVNPVIGTHLFRLTDREMTVIALIGRGYSTKAMAPVLGISAGTVKWHLKNCYQKLGVSSKDAALKVLREEDNFRIHSLCPNCGETFVNPIKSA